MEKLIIDDTTKEKIVESYSNSNKSMRNICEEFGYSYTVIQKLINSFEFESNINKNYPIIDNYEIIATCKKTGKIFHDYKNESGAIATHVFSLYPHESNNSKYLRKNIEYKTGKFWYDQYFNFSYIEKKILKKCHYCDWVTSDINNTSGAYEKHLINVHNITISNHLITNPNDSKYFKKHDTLDRVTCKICGKKLLIINNTHLKKHGISVDEYKLKYDDNVVSPSSHDKLKHNIILNNMNSTFSKTSAPENEIKKFLTDNDIEIKQSLRKPLNGVEIDLYSDKHRIGIEFNGNLFHTELYGKKDFNYHLNKTKIAELNNIKLLHIHEDEWINKKEIIKHKLLYLFNKSNGIKLHARKCLIKETTKNEKIEFLERYHIQGNDQSNIFYGAYFNNTLVAVMTFNNKRNLNKEKTHTSDVYELSRFCCNYNYIVNGIASKLLSHFIKKFKPKKIISFADRRWTPIKDNNLYTLLGFKLTNILKPDYHYYDRKLHRSNRLHKFGFGKSNIKKRFPNVYNINKTEWEMMQELKYDRIWDCGKFKYVMNIL